MNYFKQKRALITGGSRGIGLNVTQELLQNGCFVESVQRTKKHKLSGNKNLVIHNVDLTKDVEVHKLTKKITQSHYDFVIFNAGYYLNKKYDKITKTDYQKCLNTNFLSTIKICKSLGSRLNRNSSLVFVSSSAARSCHANTSLYSATQAALEAYAKVVAKELAPKVRVNIVAPGVTDTDLLNESIKKSNTPSKEELKKSIPLQKIATTEDISNAIIFLLSEKSSHVTGQILAVNGGSSI